MPTGLSTYILAYTHTQAYLATSYTDRLSTDDYTVKHAQCPSPLVLHTSLYSLLSVFTAVCTLVSVIFQESCLQA